MKTILIIVLSIGYLSASAQQIVLQAGAEKTVAGNQVGTMASIESKKLWAVGVFYQVGVGQHVQERSSQILSPFYGVVFQAPIARSEKLAFVGTLRTGFVDGKFFVVVPAVETRLRLSARIGVSIGTGMRMGHPSMTGKLFVKIF